MSHDHVHYTCCACGEGKIAFWTFAGFSFPGGFGRRRTGTLLGTPCRGQKIILNSEYSTRVLFNRAAFFPEGPRRSWFDIFPRFHYCDRILRSTLCENPASTPFFTTPSPPPSNGVPAQRNDDDNRPRTRKKYTEPIRLKFLSFFPYKCFISVFGKKKIYIYIKVYMKI